MSGRLDADDTRRKAVGLSLIVAPLVLVAGELLRRSTGSDGADLDTAGFTDDGEAIWIAVGVLEVAGVVAVLPALGGFLHIFTRRSVSLGHLAVGLLATGFVCQACRVALLAAANGSAARLTRSGEVVIGTDSVTALAYANTLEHPLALLGLVVIATLLLGLLALANAVWSSKVFPRWTAVVMAAAALSCLALDYGFPYLLIVIPWSWIGWKVLRMAPADWARLSRPRRACKGPLLVVALSGCSQ